MADSTATIEIVEDVRFLRPPQPFNWQDYIPQVVAALLLLGIVVLAFFLIRNRIRKGPNAKARALRALERARGEREVRGEFWYVLRSNRILRDFFMGMFETEAPAQTSRQFLETLTRIPVLDDGERSWLETYLESCDRIRYQGHAPDKEALDRFDAGMENLIRSLYRKKRKNPELALSVAEEPSPFLPGTPVPVLDEDGDGKDFTHSKPAMESLETPVSA